MSTLTEPGAFDALEKAADDEPFFMLLARDEDAPATVTEWCRLRRNRAMKLYGHSKGATKKALFAKELAQCANAEQLAIEMAEWREGQDAPAAVRISHGVQRTELELAEAAARDRLAKAVRHLREADYYVCEARDALVELGKIGEVTQGDLAMMMARLKGIVDEHTPRRAGHEAEPVLPLVEAADG